MANATDKQGGPFIYAEGQNAAGQPDGTRAVIGPQISRETFMEDAQLALMVLYRSGLWHKGMNADLVDSKHAAYLTTAVNEDDVDHPDLNDSSPATPSGGLNVKWQVATAQNTDSQTPVSAYVPFSSISTATAVSTDYVVITDTSDSNNPKRALVSDIATATLSGIGSGTPVAADTFVFVDADDGVAKKGSAADTLVALGGAPSSTAVTAASVLADNEIPKIDGASRAVQASAVYIEDISGSAMHVHGPDNASPVTPTAVVLRSGNATGGTVDSGNTIIDTGTSGGGTAGTVQVGVTTANAVEIGRSGKTTTISGNFALPNDDVQVSEGGTGASTAQDARTNLLPTKTGNALKVLRVNAGETDYELAASAGGSGLTHPQVMARGVFGGPF